VIPFNRAFVAPGTPAAVCEALSSGETAGNGPVGRRCEEWLEENLGVGRALLTPSGTAALELAAMLLGLEPGDEVIMPSFTFPTTASAFVRVGAIPVFVDIRPDTLNIDPDAVAAAITTRTRAIVPVHYGGNACDMDALEELAETHALMLVEDAAHSVLARHGTRALGSIGALAALSFHETKNLSCGEGGALLVNDAALLDQAEILREKGTDRSRFRRGEVDRYTWLAIGSSYVLSEVAAATLWEQFQCAEQITARRVAIWESYRAAFADLEASRRVRGPVIGAGNLHNGHVYYLLARDRSDRDAIIARLLERDIHAVFHYVPLHSSPAGRTCSRTHGDLKVTDDASARLLRLPLWADLSDADLGLVIDAVREAVA
jgi:dTDP-4-amino-4,6-dideoxygalactose transaminase